MSELDFDVIIDKIIEITEKNLSMQTEFLKAIYELKSRFDSEDRDHKDFSEALKILKENSFQIIEKMKMASNETIIGLIQDLIEQIDILEKIKENIQCLQSEKKEREDHRLTLLKLHEDVKSISISWNIVRWIVTFLAGLITLATIIFGWWQKNEMSLIRSEIQKEIKSINIQTNTNK